MEAHFREHHPAQSIDLTSQAARKFLEPSSAVPERVHRIERCSNENFGCSAAKEQPYDSDLKYVLPPGESASAVEGGRDRVDSGVTSKSQNGSMPENGCHENFLLSESIRNATRRAKTPLYLAYYD
ncbi:hypothetical protein EAH_00030390 [Eimeria acervulina]|uniref:Uncharacterized protein n=1 Tax=Eimeria acervulina TaxID=5801 RepID=U6GHU2_EIMAC|nr:hypothetical protein EAH_00030390 [Eimeria acervulina]CDI78144.1 hypothetical protein EAH_00030390 [Eimeria acervulina]